MVKRREVDMSDVDIVVGLLISDSDAALQNSGTNRRHIEDNSRGHQQQQDYPHKYTY